MESKSGIEVMASLVHPRGGNWRNRYVMMEGYFDESGIHDKAKVCIVAGFYGDQKSWREFERAWNGVIADYPELTDKGFHAKRFYGRNRGQRVGEYAGWSDGKADGLLERLTVCITSGRIFPMGYGVMVDDFIARPLVNRQWLTGAKFNKANGKAKTSGCPRKPYYVPFQFSILKSAQQSGATAEDKLHVFVGIDRTLHGYASEFYKFLLVDDRLSEDMRVRLGTLLNPLAKDTPGLQAADLIAYEMYTASLRAIQNPAKYRPPDFLMRLLRNWQGNPSVKLFNTEVFDGMEREGEAAYQRLMAEQGK